MTTIEARIANLSPAKRALLEKHLQAQSAQRINEQQTIPRRAATEAAPLSFSQQRLWFLQQLEPGNRAFHNCTAWQLTGSLNKDALTRSLAEIVRRHAVLRTRIVVQGGEPVQCIDPVAPFHLPFTDLRLLPAAQQATQLDALLYELQQRPYDFAVEHSWRFHLAQLQDNAYDLIIARHHIATDGWSGGIFQRELSLLYTAFSQDESLALPPLPIQYADFAVWQRAQLQGARLEQQLAYWWQQLQNPPVLQLPTDTPRTAAQSHAAATHEFTLPPQLTAALNALSKAQGVTLYMTLLTVFKILLFRYTGQQDLSVGAPIAGRSSPEVEGLIGFFLNTLVLRSQINPAASFLAFLAQVRQTTLDAYAHQDVPVEKLIEVLQPDRTLTNSPLFQVLFLLQNMPRHALDLPGLRVTRLSHETEAAYDLSCTLREEGDQIMGQLTYRCDLFHPATMARLAGHYQTLLASAVANPTCPIATLPMLTDVECHQQLIVWNQTQVEHPLEKSLVELFAEQVAQRPTATAFLTDAATLTYSELNQHADQLAYTLRTAGVEKGAIVGVCLPRSLDAIIALLAIFKAGGVYLPLDPTYPRERLAFLLADAQAPFVVTNTHLQATLPTTTAKLICLDTLQTTESRSSSHLVTQSSYDIAGEIVGAVCNRTAWVDRAVTNRTYGQNDPNSPTGSSCPPVSPFPCLPTDPAYIIYTSGSTGQPKGAVVPHRQILNRLWWMWRKYPFQADEMSCQKTALNFVDSLWELLGPLLQGSPTVILPDEVVRDPQQLIQSLARHGVTRLWLVPTLLRAMLQSTPELDNSLPKLRFLVTSGEALPTELFQQAKAKLPRATLYNLYGTSEVWDATWYDPTESPIDNNSSATIPIGKPIDNVQTYILDAQQQPVPIGVTGELYVGGAGLADGYLNRPELTQARFVTLEESRITNHELRITPHLYRTGDLARYLPDGTIEFIGRADFQVKLRGFRIELGEIEAVLNQHASVNQSVVVVQENEAADTQLAAYMVATLDADLTAARLRQALKEHLPAYMIPVTYTWIDRVPLTPSGKVDRQALPLPTSVPTTTNTALTPARDELEMQLVQIWQKTLRVHPIGIYDNFFEVGGHSLLAVTLFDRIAKATGKTLPLSILLQSPTIAQQAAILRQQAWQPRWSSLAAVRAGGTKPPLFLVPPTRGTALSFTKLARHLDPDQPIYAFDPVGLDSTTTPLPTVEAMATHYLQEMTLFQPEGPYRLGGMCLGGMVALEMARQLLEANKAVACLVLLDPGSPKNGPDWRWTPPQKTAIYYVAQLIAHTKNGLLGISFRYQWRRVQKLFGKRLSHLEALQQVQIAAIDRYVAAPIGQPILLVQSAQFAAKPEHQSRWSALAPAGLTYQVVPGTTHLSLVAKNDAHIALLASHVQRYLDQFTTPLGANR